MTDKAMVGLFDDGKDPDALRTIGEVSRALGIRQHVLRYWEDQFPMLRPIKRSGGRRYYRPEDIALIAQIDRLVHSEGYTLRGAKQAIASKTGASDVPAAVKAVPLATKPQGAASGAQSLLPMLDDRDDGRVQALLSGLDTVRRQLAAALESAG